MVKSRRTFALVVKYLVVTVVCAVMIYPLLWMLSSSFKEEFYIFKEPGLWPSHFTLENYIDGWKGGADGSFGRYFVNTLLLVLAVMCCNLASCSLTAFAFARMRFRGKKILFALVLFTMMMPNHVLIVPRYIIFNSIGWIDSYLPMIVPKLLATEGFFVYLLIQFIKGIPIEIDQSAIVDGCGWFRIYFNITLPLALPALATVSIFFVYLDMERLSYATDLHHVPSQKNRISGVARFYRFNESVGLWTVIRHVHSFPSTGAILLYLFSKIYY